MKNIKIFYLLSLLLFSNYITATSQTDDNNTYVFNPNIDTLRALALTFSGELPTQINVEKVAETIRPASVVVKGDDPDRKMTLSRTVYQLEYPNGNIMLDSGMDLITHETFGKNKEPYFPEKFKQVEEALLQAKLIILTHYHADHVAGVIRSANFDKLATKTWVSSSTADLLINTPHKPTTVIDKSKVDKFIIEKDQPYMLIAPGVVLFMAPGHTADSKMIYIRLADGREYIHSVDSGWSMENIRKEKIKNAAWVSENEKQLMKQYKWLNKIEKNHKNIIILCSHDNEQYNLYTSNGTLGNGLKIK